MSAKTLELIFAIFRSTDNGKRFDSIKLTRNIKMKYCCPFCSTRSDVLSCCSVCGTVLLEKCQKSKDTSNSSSGGFWMTVLIIVGLGLLMQVSALFL